MVCKTSDVGSSSGHCDECDNYSTGTRLVVDIIVQAYSTRAVLQLQLLLSL